MIEEKMCENCYLWSLLAQCYIHQEALRAASVASISGNCLKLEALSHQGYIVQNSVLNTVLGLAMTNFSALEKLVTVVAMKMQPDHNFSKCINMRKGIVLIQKLLAHVQLLF